MGRFISFDKSNNNRIIRQIAPIISRKGGCSMAEFGKIIFAWTKVTITGGKYAGQSGIVSSCYQNFYSIKDPESAVHVELNDCYDTRVPVPIKAKHLKVMVEQNIAMTENTNNISEDTYARLRQLFPGRTIKINCSHSKYNGLLGTINDDGNPLVPHSLHELISVFISHPACSNQKLWFEAQYLIPQGPNIYTNGDKDARIIKQKRKKR